MDEVRVWLVRSPLPRAAAARLSGLLDERERARAAALDPVGRLRFVAAHGAARLLAAASAGVAPQALRWAYGPHGKPEVDGVRVSLSHSGDLAAVALTPARAVGVDVQRHTPGLDPLAMSARYFPAGEAGLVAASGERAAEFARLWARKEACVKATGGRLTQGLALPVAGGPVVAGAYHVVDVPVPAGFAGAVALCGPEPFRVTTAWWSVTE
ncbi:4'-phosphopantetheinyl transferase superfamily protein [Phytohabitans sp. ZYX-F-186]|uniref:4'-phosphopantetheinyl transferase superfamily protein n=1 Tax=Phytohabitans maris TaxID=3071409 RepID=A0ABU0ZV74_9ACTN|nr:4'-phosphopantetheinyl transferase superfamily protein [Phytohabitans sp. ZYX-F-186]MDQ7910887.1 4'-phosphopantetheinyl transferase superfamily protein [Phytohabitans sp. ZYX-F-186]